SQLKPKCELIDGAGVRALCGDRAQRCAATAHNLSRRRIQAGRTPRLATFGERQSIVEELEATRVQRSRRKMHTSAQRKPFAAEARYVDENYGSAYVTSVSVATTATYCLRFLPW